MNGSSDRLEKPQSPYNAIFRAHAQAFIRLVESGEIALARVLAMLERETSAAGGEDLARSGHVFSDSIHYIPAFSASITNQIHRLLARDRLLEVIPADCDQIVELGGGWGSNLFHLWLSGAPKDAEYVSLEPSGVGRDLSERLSGLAPRMRFKAGYLDILNMDIAPIITGKKVFIFSCYTIALVPWLPANFFANLLAQPAIFGGCHIEPGAWQYRPQSKVNSRSRDYSLKHGRNGNLFSALEQAQAEGMLRIDEILPNYYAVNPLEPLSFINWTRAGSRTLYTLGQPIDFSAAGNSLTFRRRGWSQSESWGCWTDGPEAELSIALREPSKGETTLSASVQGFVHSGKPSIKVQIYGNGHELGSWNVSGAPSQYKLNIPASMWHPFGILDLSLSIEDATSPKALGLSEDDRRLGLGVSTIAIS